MHLTFIAKKIIIAVFCLFAAHSVSADTDLQLNSPKEYQVFQRSSMYEGYIRVRGHIRPDFDNLQVRISGTSLKGSLPDEWQNVTLLQQSQCFTAVIPVVPGGWYKVDLLALKNNQVVAQASVNHVGVGEVFVGAGQSNSTNCAQYKTNQTSGMVSSFSGESWRLADDPQLGAHDKTKDGSFWPAFGDAMYVKYHVPIGVAVTGHGGTYSLQWLPDNPMGLFSWTMTRIYQLGSNGFRAVLWHQGESDVTENTPSDVYVSRLTNIITQSNTLAGWQFPWFVAHVSYISAAQPTNSVIRGAQQQLWTSGIALEGPDTDTLGSDYRDNTGVHFNLQGLHAHGQMWADKVGVYLDKVL